MDYQHSPLLQAPHNIGSQSKANPNTCFPSLDFTKDIDIDRDLQSNCSVPDEMLRSQNCRIYRSHSPSPKENVKPKSNSVTTDIAKTGCGFTTKTVQSSSFSTTLSSALTSLFTRMAKNGPNDTLKPKLWFGPSVSKPSEGEPAAKARKRPKTDAADNEVLTKIPTTSSAPNVPKESNAAQAIQKPTFSFATIAPVPFRTVQPSTSWMPFPFNTGTSATTTTTIFGGAAFARSTPSQSIFGGVKATTTCSSSSVPASGSPVSNTEVCKSHFNGFIFLRMSLNEWMRMIVSSLGMS